MTKIRPPTHAGTWYSANHDTLSKQLTKYFSKAPKFEKGARVIVGPHAGYTYCGERLAESYSVWDLTNTKCVFILGPSHHVYFKDKVLVSQYDAYETPLGNIKVNTGIRDALIGLGKGCGFEKMSESVEDDEHLFEMHLPFLAWRCKQDQVSPPKIVPIMFSSLSEKACEKVIAALLPYFNDDSYTFIVLSDFCHWGKRFGYTEYVASGDLDDLVPFHESDDRSVPIYESIKFLDQSAMLIASEGSLEKWSRYIKETGNTICGQKPINVVLKLIEKLQRSGGRTASSTVFEWIGYSQSGKAIKYSDSSVSYASGYVRLLPSANTSVVKG